MAKRDGDRSNGAKAQVRRHVLAEIGADRARVLDAFAGAGHMHAMVWHEAAFYCGCDKVFYRDGRLAYVADNLRVLRVVNLANFNIFDLDAYGSPWQQLYIIAANRKVAAGERVGIILTEGQGLKLKMGGMSLALAKLSGVRDRLPGSYLIQDEIIDRALRQVATMMEAQVVRHWRAASKQNSTMRYIGMVFARIGEAA